MLELNGVSSVVEELDELTDTVAVVVPSSSVHISTVDDLEMGDGILDGMQSVKLIVC